MLLTIHATAGAIIGQQINNPFLAFILAFASHFLLDIIPHGDSEWINEYKNNQKEKIKKIITVTIIDIFALIVLMLLVYPFKSLGPTTSIALGMIGSVLPDCLVGFHELSKKSFEKFHRFHFLIHDFIKFQPSPVNGLFLQIIILAALLFAL